MELLIDRQAELITYTSCWSVHAVELLIDKQAVIQQQILLRRTYYSTYFSKSLQTHQSSMRKDFNFEKEEEKTTQIDPHCITRR